MSGDKTTLGDFEQLVLLAVLQLGEEAYGVPIAEEIQRRTGREAARAAVYIALRRLERHGLVSSRLGDPSPQRGGRPRRYFTVEPEGVDLLRSARRALDCMWRGLEPLLEDDPDTAG